MPLVPVRTAADLTRRHRSTITRAIEKGRLSASLSEDGRYLIDPAELERVFGKLARADVRAQVRTGAVHRSAQANAQPRAQARAAAGAEGEGRPDAARVLAREVELLREQLERERLERERERLAFEEERRFLRGLVESHGEQVRLLSRPAEPARRRWWPW